MQAVNYTTTASINGQQPASCLPEGTSLGKQAEAIHRILQFIRRSELILARQQLVSNGSSIILEEVETNPFTLLLSMKQIVLYHPSALQAEILKSFLKMKSASSRKCCCMLLRRSELILARQPLVSNGSSIILEEVETNPFTLFLSMKQIVLHHPSALQAEILISFLKMKSASSRKCCCML